MNTFDIHSVWKSDHNKAQKHYQSLEDVEKLARNKSQNILHKLYRYVMAETLLSYLLVVLIGLGMAQFGAWVLAAYIAFMLVIIFIASREFMRFHKALKRVNTQKVAEALKEYERLIANYIKRNKILVDYVVPIGFVIGFTFGAATEWEGIRFTGLLTRIGIGIGIGILVVLLIRYLTHRYYDWAYGRPYRSLQKLRLDLEQEEGHNEP